ncbi:MAG: TetR family transcriptional regulator [Eubacteriales bacterium]|nr:TetR family transcriptional regulator [Eubacteriales bacterium]
MPKVSEEYIQKKKNMIVQAAYTLCLRKTVSTVTMQDIINETGLSQGGIYRFYKDIDAIFSDMFLFLREKESIKAQVDEILSHADDVPMKEITNRIFDMLADFMERELMGIAKVDFEINVLAMNEPERVDQILKNIPNVGNMEYLTMRMMQYMTDKMKAGKMHPRVSIEELFSFISSSFSGIQMTCIVNNCYKQEENPFSHLFQPKIQLQTLARTVNYLIGEE